MREEKTKRILAVLALAGYIYFIYYLATINKENLEWLAPEVPIKVNVATSPEQIKDSSVNSTEEYVEESKNTRAIFFGDLMIDRHVKELIDKRGMDVLFEKLDWASSTSREITDYDLVSVNLEGAVTDGGAHYAPQNAYDFAFPPDRIARLKDYGFNFFNLANNHFSDQGERGMNETRMNLDNLNISYVGCKDREVGDCSSRIIDANGMKIGMAGFSQVYGLLNIEEVSKKINTLASSSDYVVVNIHWGTEYEHKFNKSQQMLAHRLIDSGADLIIGHHPHVVQGLEIYDGKAIFYSLGNFIFDQYFSEDTQTGLAVGAIIETARVSLSLFPLESKVSQVYFSSGQKRTELLNDIAAWSDSSEVLAGQIKEGFFILDK